jgi:hypothetical protein
MKLHIAVLALAVTPFAVAAADQPRRPHRPPPAAIAACEKLRAGDACTVRRHDRDIAGTCNLVPDTSTLACRPNHPPPPPKAALDACTGKSEGDACSFQLDTHTLSGNCARGPDATRPLACRPPHP